MAIEYVVLKISESVAAGLEVCVSYAPPATAKQVIIEKFAGDAPYTEFSTIRVLWDDIQVWSTKGDKPSESLEEVLTGMDDVKLVKLCCGNGQEGSIYMSGKVIIKVVI